ncbi:MAG: serine/threonine protein kinase, partial [Phycisphaerales bacterium]|nr:serine/threonine protein kinase [Phycisphaerales bacterium]
MDAKTYERVREEFLRVHELPKPELEAALEQLDRDEPEIAVELRKLLAGTTNGGSQDPGFEDAIHRGLAGGAQELIPTLRLSSGTEVGPFSIESYINDGGFGEVYLALQDDPNREVALKIIKPGMDSAQVIRRFRQEREALAKMNHPSVAGFYQAGSTPAELGSRPYFAMEFVHGATITEYCIRQNLMIEARIELFIEVCAAVQHAHSKGVIHRDLKPSNVLIAEMDGKAVPKVIDFGIAKALDHRLGQMSVNTVEGQFLGTPAYMSPEQAGGGDIDTRTDVYALGVMLYELLTNALPFDSRTLADLSLAELQRVIRESTPTRPSQKVKDAGQKAASESRARVAMARRLQPDLDDIIMQCLEKEPKDRYPTASALAEDLQRFLEGKPVEAVRAHGLYRTKKWVQRHKLVVSITAAVTLLVFTSLTTAVISFALKLDESRKLVDTTKTLEQVQVELEDSQQERDSNAQEAGRLAAEVAGSLADLESMTAQRNEAQREIDDTKAHFEASQAELA